MDEQKEGIKMQNRHSKRENQKEKRQQKRKLLRKTCFFEMTGKYVKVENEEKVQKKDNQIEDILQKRDTFQQGQQERETKEKQKFKKENKK